MSEQKFIWLTDFFEGELILKISAIISVKAIENSTNSEISYFTGDKTVRVTVTQTVQEILKYIEPKWFPKGSKTVAVDVEPCGECHLQKGEVCDICGKYGEW